MPPQVSYWSRIPCAQFKICSAQQDSPLSKTVSTLFSIPFGEPGLASQITTDAIAVGYLSLISRTQLEIHKRGKCGGEQ